MHLRPIVASVCALAVCRGGEPAAHPKVLIATSMGDITVELWPEAAPKTVENFIGLAEGTKEWTDPRSKEKKTAPFYDGLIFHRVIERFMIQGGCPLGKGSGDPGFKFADEINAAGLGLDKEKALPQGRQGPPHEHYRGLLDGQHGWREFVRRQLSVAQGLKPESSREETDRIIAGVNRELRALGDAGVIVKAVNLAKHTELTVDDLEKMSLKDLYEKMGYHYDEKLVAKRPKRGVLAMANSGPDTNGSQFFINLVDTPHLAGKHTVFGAVSAGMEVVDAIGKVKVDKESKPVEDVTIRSIRLIKAP